MKLYFAISKETGELITGARGQGAFTNARNLRRSLGQDFFLQREAREKGVRVMDLYDVHEIPIERAILKSEKDSSFDLKIIGESLSVSNNGNPQAFATFDKGHIFTVASLMELAFRAGAQGYGFTFEVIKEEEK